MSKFIAKVKGYAAYARKALVPVVALIAQAVALGVFHGTALDLATAVIGLASAAGVYKVQNGAKPSA